MENNNLLGVISNMTTVIINQFSPKRVNYLKALKDLEDELILLTKSKQVELFKENFENVVGFDNFERNDRLYSHIIDINKDKKIDNVIATHEFDLVKAGYLRGYLGIRGQNSESATLFRDKYKMKERLQNSIKTPAFKRVSHVFDLIQFKEKNGYPIVLKPVDSAGSVDVEIIKNDQTFDDVLERGIKHKVT